MTQKMRGSRTVLSITVLLCLTLPAHGQFGDVLSAIFGTPTAPPATPTVISTTTPSTPEATAAAIPDATPAAVAEATPAAADATPTVADVAEATPSATPAATPAAVATATTTTPAAATAATPKTTPAAAAKVAVAVSPGAATPAISTLPKQTPAAAKKPTPPPPPPPAPIVIDPTKLVPALPADQTAASSAAAPSAGAGIADPEITAVDVVLRVAGPGVTPFVIPQQTVLLRSMASVLTTVSLADLRIRYVTSDANSRRRLLSESRTSQAQVRRGLLAEGPAAESAAAAAGQLYNVAAVTLEANCSSSSAVAATLTEMQSVVTNNLLSSAFQSYGQAGWGVTLLSLTAVNPNAALETGTTCVKSFGAFCLDHTSLSVAALKGIIAVGVVVCVMLLAMPCVLLEWRRKSGQVAALDPTPQTPKTPLDRMQQMYNRLVDTVKAASPMRGSSPRRSAFRNDTPKSAQARAGTVSVTATQP